MIESIEKRLSQLAEINRALAHDLDISRRVAAELGRERDALQSERDELAVRLNYLVGALSGKAA